MVLAIISRVCTALSFSLLVFLGYKNRKKDIQVLLPIIQVFLCLFFILFPVVNPWYLLPIIMLTVFVPKQSILLWSALCVASALALRTSANENIHALASSFYLLIIVIWIIKDRKTTIEISTKNLN
jgi:O-antigen/teichoic acid export membrane protein